MATSAEAVHRITRVWVDNAVALAETLADTDPSWGSETTELAGGALVLCGPGLFVNRAIGVGHQAPLTDEEWDLLEERSGAVGVAPAIEITPATHPEVLSDAVARGYQLDDVEHALVRSTDLTHVPPPDPRFDIVPANRGLLPVWQETAACAWGHLDEGARRANDAFARAAALVDGERFALIRHAGSGRPLGCASLTIRAGVATLGGMSTLPEQRGQGVQTALIRHRLRVAAASGCDLATSIAAPDSPSERNLLRQGFEPLFRIEHWMRRTGAETDGSAA